MTVRVKGIIFEDFVNYKKPCLVIQMPFCTFKCDEECGQQVCQNSELANMEDTYVDPEEILQWYLNKNTISEAFVFQGLEPFDSFLELRIWIYTIRKYTQDDIVIYTGYNKNEISPERLKELAKFKNIIIKYGRFIPNQKSHFDEILGVDLSSPNQYAEVLTKEDI